MSAYTITADSTPVYGWISDYWSADDWIYWYSQLFNQYGKDVATQKFVNAFNSAPPFSANVSWRSGNDTFIKFAQQEGFYDQLFPGIFGSVARLIGGAHNVVNQSVQTAENVTTSAALTAEWIIPVTVVVAIGLGSFYIYKTFIKRSAS